MVLTVPLPLHVRHVLSAALTDSERCLCPTCCDLHFALKVARPANTRRQVLAHACCELHFASQRLHVLLSHADRFWTTHIVSCTLLHKGCTSCFCKLAAEGCAFSCATTRSLNVQPGTPRAPVKATNSAPAAPATRAEPAPRAWQARTQSLAAQTCTWLLYTSYAADDLTRLAPGRPLRTEQLLFIPAFA